MKPTEPAIGVLIRSHQDRWREWIMHCSKRSLQTWSINEISSSWNSKAYDMKSTWNCLPAHMLIQLRDHSLYATKILSLFLPTCRKGNVCIALRELIVSYSQIRCSKLKSTFSPKFRPHQISSFWWHLEHARVKSGCSQVKSTWHWCTLNPSRPISN